MRLNGVRVTGWMGGRLGVAGLAVAIAIGTAGAGGCATSNAEKSGGAASAKAAGVAKAAPKGKPGAYAVIDGAAAPVPAIPMGDARTIERIITEAQARSQVMAHLTKVTSEFGPRLTGSTASQKSEEWARDQLLSWGWDAKLVQWGEVAVRWDRGPQWARVIIKRPGSGGVAARGDDRDGTKTEDTITIKPPAPEGYRVLRNMQFTTMAWTPGTDGPRRGKVVRMPKDEAEFLKIKDQLKDAWVLVPRLAMGEPAGVDTRRGGGMRGRFEQRLDARKKAAEGKPAEEMSVPQRVLLEGVSGFISASQDERVWTSSVPGWREREAKDYGRDVEVSVRLSDYDYLSSRVTDGDAIEVEINLPVTITPGPIPVYNVVADLKGTEKPDEVVVICGHFDSWNGPGSQGTCDNGTGSMVMLEAARLLSVAKAKPKRTIRLILWTGEEQGLLGARAYVKQQKDNWNKFSACLNDDGGSNYQGGLPAIKEMVPYLAAATAPINGRFYSPTDNKYMDVNVRVQAKFTQVAASDHYAFVEAGIPGFFWDEEGRADYWYAWHTQNDRIDQAIEEYLVQSSACSAVTAYNLACAPGLLPRWLPDEKTETTPVTPDRAGPGQPPRTRESGGGS